jgi:hypothetical protein
MPQLRSSAGPCTYAGASASAAKAKRKMVVSFKQPMNTALPVPAW